MIKKGASMNQVQSRLADEIVAVECFPVVIPLKHPLVMSTYSIESAESLFVCIRTRGGATGWGEAAPNAVMTGETLVSMVAAMDAWVVKLVVGQPVLGCRHRVTKALSLIYGNGSVKSAVDMALLDLEGRLLGVPVVELLGGMARNEVRVVRLLDGQHDGLQGPSEVIASAAQMQADGFTAFKLKVGVASSVKDDAEAVRQLRKELGDHALIGADANMGWDLGKARHFVSEATQYDLAFLEQPLLPSELANMARLQKGTAIPISADEAIHNVSDIFGLNAARAISGVSLKANKTGGVTSLVQAAHLCDALGLRVNVAMLLESSLSCAAMVHAACAIPQVDWGLVLGNAYLLEDPVSVSIECQNGHVAPIIAAGLGIDVDVSMLRKFAA